MITPDNQSAWVELLTQDIPAFNIEINKIPVSERLMFRGANLAGLDISQANIKHCDLTKANLAGSSVSGLSLSRCRLQETQLENIRLDDDYWEPVITQIQMLWRDVDEWNAFRGTGRSAILESANFTGADLGCANLSNMTFTTARFDGARLGGCNLNATSFIGASLVNTDCTNLCATSVNLEDAMLDGIRFDRAELRFCKMSKASAVGASFAQTSLFRTDMHGIKAFRTSWDGAMLDRVLLFDAHLDGSSFRNAKLTNCNLIDASLIACVFDYAEAIDNKMTDAITAGASFVGVRGAIGL
ncbi:MULTISPECIES: pentapeptide repeat-containing protein [Aerosakkonema]|uniref:pentapeptide repeat-containing protein n=1 Tax=Aerosakkonema TaxID=1246629 RepID=UPI0035BB7EC4